MTEVSKELIYKTLMSMHERADRIDRNVDEMKTELQGMRSSAVAIHRDLDRIHQTLARHDSRLDRLELSETITP